MNSSDKTWAVFWVMFGLVIITAIVAGATHKPAPPEPIDPAKSKFIQTCVEKGKAAQINHYSVETWSCK